MGTQSKQVKGKSLIELWMEVQMWCLQRGINQVYAFFKGCDPAIAAHETRIRFVQRNPHAPELVAEDGLWLDSMKATMEALDARRATLKAVA